MHRGEMIENEKTEMLFKNPKFPYTRALLFARPQIEKHLERLPSIADFVSAKKSFKTISIASRKKSHQLLYAQSPLLEVEKLSKEYPLTRNWFKENKSLKAVENLSFNLYPGETLGLVGESGCGKSTVSLSLIHI